MLGRANIEVSSKVKIANYRYDKKKKKCLWSWKAMHSETVFVLDLSAIRYMTKLSHEVFNSLQI